MLQCYNLSPQVVRVQLDNGVKLIGVQVEEAHLPQLVNTPIPIPIPIPIPYNT